MDAHVLSKYNIASTPSYIADSEIIDLNTITSLNYFI
jgi:hypothetical protein